MAIPSPENGLVIRYSFLWSDDYQDGEEEGAKDRPCAIILTKVEKSGAEVVSVVPVTHSAPKQGQAAIYLSRHECQSAGLDQKQNWVILEEINRFEWPGYDLRRIPGTDDYHYGRLSEATYKRILRALLRVQKERAAAGLTPITTVPRD